MKRLITMYEELSGHPAVAEWNEDGTNLKITLKSYGTFLVAYGASRRSRTRRALAYLDTLGPGGK